MSRPNFFIVGAPKCGTTALSEYLRMHPNVFMSTPKEPHYFATDIPGHRVCKTLEEYLMLFSEASDDHLAIGEASVHYLYSQEATKHICDFDRNAKLLVMLRNPVDMVYSMHSQVIASRDEDVEVFERAWELESERLRGHHIPKFCRDVQILYYSRIARYAEHLKRLYRYFPEDQVKVLLFEDFTSDTRAAYKTVLEFLEVPDDHRKDFPIINENKKVANSAVADFTQRPPKFASTVAEGVKRVFGIKELGVLNRLRSHNFKHVKREPLSAEVKDKIVSTYRADIEELSRMLERDLSHWLQS